MWVSDKKESNISLACFDNKLKRFQKSLINAKKRYNNQKCDNKNKAIKIADNVQKTRSD